MPDSAASKGGPTASQRITAQIAELNDWRGKMLADLRTLILAADPDITEEWKWNTAGMDTEWAGLRRRCLQGSCETQFFQRRGSERSEGPV